MLFECLFERRSPSDALLSLPGAPTSTKATSIFLGWGSVGWVISLQSYRISLRSSWDTYSGPFSVIIM